MIPVASGMVEEDEQTPVNQPRALLQLLQWVDKILGIDDLTKAIHVLHGTLPVLHEDLRSELSPECREVLFLVVAERSEVVEVVGRGRVVSALELELSILIQRVHAVCCDSSILLEMGKSECLVGLELLDVVLVVEDVHQCLAVCPDLDQLGHHEISALLHLLRH